VIVNKSTVPVGTAALVKEIVAKNTKHEFAVASNPEFLKEGNAVTDFLKPDRIIVGCENAKEAEILHKIYSPLLRLSDRFRVMDIASAELTKYAANAMLATRISFMNELALLAEEVGADIEQIRHGIGSDKRIGPRFLFAGAGFGGSCFPKDLRALAVTAQEKGVALSVVEAVEGANKRQKLVLGEKIRKHFGSNLKGARIAVWGLAFKPETDDIREAPALYAIRDMLEGGAQVVAYDPAAMDNVKEKIGERIEYAASMYEAVDGADALVMVTEWHEFRRPSFEKLKRLLRQPVLFDGRNQWDPQEVSRFGFRYYGIGRRDEPEKVV
jgi:UDPglucose 6-dehydrogenase